MILRRIHGEPRLCERGMDTNCSSAKCGRARLPRTRVVCVAVTDPADGSLRWCILRPPRTWEAGRTSNPTRLRTSIYYRDRSRAWGTVGGVQGGAQGPVLNPIIVYNNVDGKGLNGEAGELTFTRT